MQVRSGASPALSGRESTARSCGCRSQQWGRSRDWSRSDRAGTARKTGESCEGESEMERSRTHTQTPFFTYTWALSHACVWHAWRCADVRRQTVQQKNVRATGECLYTSRRTHCSCYYMRTKPPKKTLSRKNQTREKMNIYHPWPSWQKKFFNSSSGFGKCMYRTPLKKFSDFIIPCTSWSFLLELVPSVGFSSIIVSGGFSVSRGMRLWDTDLPNLLIFEDAFVWTLSTCARSI